MNKWLAFVALVFAAVACKSPALVPGKPTIENRKKLLAHISEATPTHKFIRIKASGQYEMMGGKQSFKAEIRIIRDSVIWIELSDPLIGIKVARGIVLQDSIAFVNKIDNTYIAGSLTYFNKEYKTNVDFGLLQNLLLGEPMREINPKEKLELELLEKVYALYYLPVGDVLFKFSEPNFYYEIEPDHFKVKKQEAVDGAYKISARYGQYKNVNDFYYPGLLAIDLAFENAIKLQMEFKQISTPTELRIPFNISSKYKQIK